VSDNRVKRSVYWLPHEVTKVSLNSNDAYAEQLRDRLEEAVACRTRSPYPVGSHLSGGLDSSTVTVLATRKLRAVGRDLAGAFAWAPPPRPEDYPLQDERQFIEEICQHANLTCTHVPLTADDVIEMWQGDMSQKPQVTLYHELPTRRLAKAQGIRVMLSGWGGDEFATAHGRGYYSETLLHFRLITLLRELKEASTVRETSVKNVLRRDVIQPLLPNFLYKRQIMTQAREILDDPHIRDKTRAYFKRMLLETRVAPLVRTNLYKPFYHGWLTARIECWALHGIDHQIEYRYPLLDRRVIEFCLGLPADQFVQNGWQRFIFRNAMTGLLPKAICWTPRNKMFAAQYSAMHPTVMEARDRFVAGMQSGDFNITGVSSMWQDRRLPI
ncbi:MAG: asparagine synthase, partial [Caldilineaceae bacterium]|nr:asparagine synthase [Caldilineaceae bacterium]